MAKQCTKCKATKSSDSFYKRGNGLMSHCKQCCLAYAASRKELIKERVTSYNKRYYEENRDTINSRRSHLAQTCTKARIRRSLANARERSAQRNFDFDLDKEFLTDLYHKQEGRCSLTGRILTAGGGERSHMMSLDRIDSDKGYTKGNIQWVTVSVNYMKRDMPQGMFMELCKLIGERA